MSTRKRVDAEVERLQMQHAWLKRGLHTARTEIEREDIEKQMRVVLEQLDELSTLFPDKPQVTG